MRWFAISGNFVENPNLPQRRCKIAVAGGLQADVISELKRNQIDLISPSPCHNLPQSLAEHADILCTHLGGSSFFLAEGQNEMTMALKKIGGKIEEKIPIGAAYPQDVPLNTAIMKNSVFLNPFTASKKIIDFYIKNRYNRIKVRQGYTKCSIAIVSEDALMTEDAGIYQAAIKNGFDVLLVSSGFVRLRGYAYGFLGGCCGKLSKDSLCFNGQIERHPDYQKMRAFAREHQVWLYSLSRASLYDNGGILPIVEK